MVKITKRSAILTTALVATGLITASLINASESRYTHNEQPALHSEYAISNALSNELTETQLIPVYMLEQSDTGLEIAGQSISLEETAEVAPIVININIYLDSTNLNSESNAEEPI
ncbi:MAG: hypothetical protein ACPGN3_00840 [Opitutales bacterium]